MRAMILAGGMSTRLYPLTKQVPKPIVPIAGEPISGHVMRWLSSFGYDEVAINVFYLADLVADDVRRRQRVTACSCDYLRERELTGSAGALKQMEGWFDGHLRRRRLRRPHQRRPRELVAFHKERGALATIGLVEVEEVDQYGVVVLDDDGRITGFQEKPAKGTERSKLANTGIYVFEPAIFDRIPAEHVLRLRQAGVSRAAARRAAVLRHAPERCVLARHRYARRVPPRDRTISCAAACRFAARARPASRRARRVAPDARHRRTGSHRRTHASSSTARASSGPRSSATTCESATNAVLERAIVWNGSTIGAGATVRDTIVGERYVVDDGAALTGAIVANEPSPA